MLDTLKKPLLPFWHWLTPGFLILVGCWLICFAMLYARYVHCAHEYDHDERPPPEILANNTPYLTKGNYGHMEIDFGGQWLMGRMMYLGHGQELYNRNRQRMVLNDGFPLDRLPNDHQEYRFPDHLRPTRLQAEDVRSDAENLMNWMVGGEHDSKRWNEFGHALGVPMMESLHANPFATAARVVATHETVNQALVDDLNKPSLGGPLYPPVHAILYSPLGAIDDPRIAYYVFQLLSVFAVVVSGFCVRIMTNGRVWTPVAIGFLTWYPGLQPGLTLGQNHAISLAILCVGWALACRGKQFSGGLVWGLLAFKPVWAVCFGLVPLLMWRPRFVAGMGVSGLTWCLLTLPFVGIHGWLNWMDNGKEATRVYNENRNWINLSRDLSGLIRRHMIDFDLPEGKRNLPNEQLMKWGFKWSEADLYSWILLGTVITTTVAVYLLWGRPRKMLGLSAAFLFFGFYLCCFRFMYYDTMLSAMGIIALLAYPKWFLRKNELRLRAKPDIGPADRPRAALHLNSLPLTLFGLLLLVQSYFMHMFPKGTFQAIIISNRTARVEGEVSYDYALDTYLVIGLWLWCGWAMIRGGPRPEDDLEPKREVSAIA